MAFKSISEILNKNIESKNRRFKGNNNSYFKTEALLFIKLIKDWPKIIGPRMAKNTIPLKNQNNTLTILTNHPAISQQLSFMETQIKKNIFEYYPKLKSKIKRIIFQVNPEFFEEKKQFLNEHTTISKKKSNPKLFHPYSPQYKQLKKEADILFQEVDDQELKEQLLSIFLQSRSE